MMALWLFLALAIPIAIHIFNRSEAKVVPFPFISLLPKNAAPNELQLQLREKLLLFLRLLLVACACALLTLPQLSTLWSDSWLKHWLQPTLASSAPTIVLTQDWWQVSSPQAKQDLIANLTEQANFRDTKELVLVHYNNASKKISRITTANFVAQAEQETLFTQNDNKANVGNNEQLNQQLPLIDNIWSITQAITTALPSSSNIHVFTSNRYAQFVGQLPQFEHDIQWHIHDASGAVQSEKEPIKVAIVLNDNLKASSQNALLLNQALEALSLIYPMDVDEIEAKEIHHFFTTNDIEPTSASSLNNTSEAEKASHFANYDAIIANLEEGFIPYKPASLISLSALPSPTSLEFVMSLAHRVFSQKQSTHSLLNMILPNEQINTNQAIAAPSAEQISPLLNNEDHPWRSFFIFALLVLFVIERLLSESVKFARKQTQASDYE